MNWMLGCHRLVDSNDTLLLLPFVTIDDEYRLLEQPSFSKFWERCWPNYMLSVDSNSCPVPSKHLLKDGQSSGSHQFYYPIISNQIINKNKKNYTFHLRRDKHAFNWFFWTIMLEIVHVNINTIIIQPLCFRSKYIFNRRGKLFPVAFKIWCII